LHRNKRERKWRIGYRGQKAVIDASFRLMRRERVRVID